MASSSSSSFAFDPELLRRAMQHYYCCHQIAEKAASDNREFGRLWSRLLADLMRDMDLQEMDHPATLALRACAVSMKVFPEQKDVLWERCLAVMRHLVKMRNPDTVRLGFSPEVDLERTANTLQEAKRLTDRQRTQVEDLFSSGDDSVSVTGDETKQPENLPRSTDNHELDRRIQSIQDEEIPEEDYVHDAILSSGVLMAQRIRDTKDFYGFWPQVFARPLVDELLNVHPFDLYKQLGPLGMACFVGDVDLVKSLASPENADLELPLRQRSASSPPPSSDHTIYWPDLDSRFYALEQFQVSDQEHKTISETLRLARDRFQAAWQRFASSSDSQAVRLRQQPVFRNAPSLRLFPLCFSMFCYESTV